MSTKNDRIKNLDGVELKTNSLVGSYFHGDVQRQWQGVVVAEVASGTYLVETFSWLGGDSTEQYLIELREMKEWRFYDDASWMRNRSEHVRASWASVSRKDTDQDFRTLTEAAQDLEGSK